MKKHGKLLVFALIIAAVLILNRQFGWSEILGDPENLRFLSELIGAHLWQAVALYTVLTVVGCVVLALPGATFALVAGMLFGPWLGILACLGATTLGAAAAFLVGRFFLKDSLKPLAEKNPYLKKLLFEEHSRRDVVVLMITRLVPLFPYNLQNFAYGITDIGFWKYTVCTFVFIAPGVSYFTIGAAGLTAPEHRVRYFAAAGILCLLVVALGLLLKRHYLPPEEKGGIAHESGADPVHTGPAGR